MHTQKQSPLLEIAIIAARDAGREIMTLYQTTAYKTKTDGSPVTIADERANTIILNHLEKTGIKILSEESDGTELPYPDQMWIIDPLDGTKDFLRKSGDFAVMIGLLEYGRPKLGVVYAPASDTLYYAEKGCGAYVVKDTQTTRLVVSNRESENLRFVRSITHFTPLMESVTHLLSAVLTPRGSMGIKAGVISEGGGEFYCSLGKFGEWDVCAPEIIVLEAGGRVTDIHGAPLFYGTKDHRVASGIIFSNGTCHENVASALHTAIARTSPEKGL